MTANINPVFPLTPVTESLLLGTTAGAPCTTRFPTATAGLAAAYIYLLGTAAGANGRRIDRIQVKASATAIAGATTAGAVGIWEWDGTTAFLRDEILIPAVTPSVSVASMDVSHSYPSWVLPTGHKLYASTTIQGADAANALVVTSYGGEI